MIRGITGCPTVRGHGSFRWQQGTGAAPSLFAWPCGGSKLGAKSLSNRRRTQTYGSHGCQPRPMDPMAPDVFEGFDLPVQGEARPPVATDTLTRSRRTSDPRQGAASAASHEGLDQPPTEVKHRGSSPSKIESQQKRRCF